MPRTARASVGNYCYHVLNRGNKKARIFHTAADYEQFLALIHMAQSRVHIPILAACLMPNHFHLVVRPLDAEHLASKTRVKASRPDKRCTRENRNRSATPGPFHGAAARPHDAHSIRCGGSVEML